MNTISKQNFWDPIEKSHPKAFKIFSDWIDKYKKEIGWDKLFNSDSEYQNAEGKNAPAPKFHDLPFEMQNGIFAKFYYECLNGQSNQEQSGADYTENCISFFNNHVILIFDELEKPKPPASS